MASDVCNKYSLKLSDGTYREVRFVGNMAAFKQTLGECARRGRWLTGTLPTTASTFNWTAAGKETPFEANKVVSVRQIESVFGVCDRRDGEFYKTIRCGKFMYDGKPHELEWMAEDLRYKGKNKLKPLGAPAPSGGGRLYSLAEISKWVNGGAPDSHRIDFGGMPLVADTDADGVDEMAADVTLSVADVAAALVEAYAKATEAAGGMADANEAMAAAEAARTAVETVRISRRDAREVSKKAANARASFSGTKTARDNAQKALNEATEDDMEEAQEALDKAQERFDKLLTDTREALESAQSAIGASEALNMPLTNAQNAKLTAAKSAISTALNGVLPLTELTSNAARIAAQAVAQAASWLEEDAQDAARTVAATAAKSAATQVAEARDKAREALAEAMEDSPNEAVAEVYRILSSLIGDDDNDGALGEIDENNLYAPHSVWESRQAMPKAINMAENALALVNNAMDNDDAYDYNDLKSWLSALADAIKDLDLKLESLINIHASLAELKAKRYYAPERGWRIPRYSDIALLSVYALGGILVSGTIVPNSLQDYAFYMGAKGGHYVAPSTAEKLNNLLSETWPYITTLGKAEVWGNRKRLGFDATVQSTARKRRRYDGYAVRRIQADENGKRKTDFATFYIQTERGSKAVTLMSGTVIAADTDNVPRALRLVRTVPAQG